MAKKALVLGGGGAKGSYQMGVWQALREAECDFDMIVGTSIGALNGAMMVQNDFEVADELWNTIEYENIFGEQPESEIRYINSTLDMVRFAINDAALVGKIDSTPLEALIKSAVDEDKIRAARSELGLVTVELPLLRPVTPMIGEIPRGKLYQYLMASSACFPVFSPYEIDGAKYIDGGYYDNVPINFAAARGADEILAVDLDGVGFVRSPKSAEDISVTRISSHWDLGAVFDFDQNLFARNRRLGYFETLKAFGQKEGHYYTFANGEAMRNLKRVLSGAEQMLDDIAALLKRPIAKTLTSVEHDGAIELLSRLDRRTNAAELLCGIAETAGVVYGISPEREYSFDEFNNELIDKYMIRQELLSQKESFSVTGDIRRVMAAVLEAKEEKLMSAALTQLMRTKKHGEATRLLSSVIPREFIAAKYVELLLNIKG